MLSSLGSALLGACVWGFSFGGVGFGCRSGGSHTGPPTGAPVIIGRVFFRRLGLSEGLLSPPGRQGQADDGQWGHERHMPAKARAGTHMTKQ